MSLEMMPQAVELIRSSREAVLATLEPAGPFTSAINYFWKDDGKFGKGIVLMSDLARHTQNAKKNAAVSAHVVESSNAPLYQRPRVSVQGRLAPVTDSRIFEAYKNQYLKIFPGAQIFFTLADFRFYELIIEELYFIAGFGKAQSFK